MKERGEAERRISPYSSVRAVRACQEQQGARAKWFFVGGARAKWFFVGQEVDVTRDNGEVFRTTVALLPWQLGHGQWVIGVAGISGGYDLARVRPAATDAVERIPTEGRAA